LIPGHKVLAAGTPNKRVYQEGEVDQIVTIVWLPSILLAEHGARLVILRYPAPDMEASNDMVKRIAAARNIPYVSALDFIPKTEFEDIYHLNPHGSGMFTEALGPALGRELSRLRGN